MSLKPLRGLGFVKISENEWHRPQESRRYRNCGLLVVEKKHHIYVYNELYHYNHCRWEPDYDLLVVAPDTEYAVLWIRRYMRIHKVLGRVLNTWERQVEGAKDPRSHSSGS